MACLAEKEQEILRNEIYSTFISLYELCNMMKRFRQLSDHKLSNAASLLLTQVKFYISKNPKSFMGCWLKPKDKMATIFELKALEFKDVIDELNYIIENDQFSGKLKTQRMGIFRNIFGDEMLWILSNNKNNVYSSYLYQAFSLANKPMPTIENNKPNFFKIFSMIKPISSNDELCQINYNPDNLREFIELIIDPTLLDENGKMPTYSRLHAKLGHRHPNKKITAKNTIKKYLNDL